MKSRWFPLGLAILQSVCYVALIAYNTWKGSRDLPEFLRYVRQDLSRPFFEPPMCCHGQPTSPELAEVADLCEITAFNSRDGAAIAIHIPAYAVAAAVRAPLSHSDICFEALINPRGQVFVAPIIPLLWFFVGRTIRRISQHRWHPPAESLLSKAVFSLGLTLLPLGLLGLLGVVLGIFLRPWDALRAAGIAFWSLYIASLAAERLRRWPFSEKTA